MSDENKNRWTPIDSSEAGAIVAYLTKFLALSMLVETVWGTALYYGWYRGGQREHHHV